MDIALEVLEAGAAHIELTTALDCPKPSVLAMLGRIKEAEDVLEIVFGDRSRTPPDEALIETGELFDSFLDPSKAESYLDQVSPTYEMAPASRRAEIIARCRIHIRKRELDEAASLLDDMPIGRPTNPGSESAELVTVAYLAVARGDPDADVQARDAEAMPRPGAHRWRRVASLLAALPD